jgi:hypothetical protein
MRPHEDLLDNADEQAWDAGIVALQESASDGRSDYERVEAAALEMLSAARRGKAAAREHDRQNARGGDES